MEDLVGVQLLVAAELNEWYLQARFVDSACCRTSVDSAFFGPWS